jgi:hypothetical protein
MSGWDDDKLATLRRLWTEGLGGPEIALALGVTPSAVRGKLRRLGLVRSADAAAQTHLMAVRAGARSTNKAGRVGMGFGAAVSRELTAWPAMPGPLPGSTPKHWLERNDASECHWPVAGEGSDLVSCCLPRDGRATYCRAHLAMAHGGAWECEAVNDDQPQGQRRAA